MSAAVETVPDPQEVQGCEPWHREPGVMQTGDTPSPLERARTLVPACKEIFKLVLFSQKYFPRLVCMKPLILPP